jgi:ABC-2 type transport system permease protein
MDTDSNVPSDAVPGSRPEAESAAPAALAATRPLYWSVRRELWESRSLYIAPLAVAALVLFSYLVGTIGLPARLRAAEALDPAQQQAKLAVPFGMAASVIILLSYIVGAFYSLEALYGERRDRSILFWKSLPVSDRLAVLAKVAVPLAVLPAIAFALGAATQAVMLALASGALLASGSALAALWGPLPFLQMPLVLLYGVLANALWLAPIYAWLLLVSAWARRAPLLWAVLLPLAFCAFGRMAWSTAAASEYMAYRVTGASSQAFAMEAGPRSAVIRLSQLDPSRFLATPGLWLGLLLAAALVALAVRVRRHREPI